MEEKLIPYFNVRQKNKIDTIVIHAAAQKGVDELIGILEERELSSHYVIGCDGEIIKLVDEKNRAWHAGAGTWNGERDINSNSIGIELCNGLFGEEKYPKVQMEALKELCLDIMDRYDIKKNNVIGHLDMAPNRKIDPGLMMDWKYLAKNGVGIWYDINDVKPLDIENLENVFNDIGYGCENMINTQWAFLRHYNPRLYRFLGGKKGANEGTIDGVVPQDNPEFLRTLGAVYKAFCDYKSENIIEFYYKKVASGRF